MLHRWIIDVVFTLTYICVCQRGRDRDDGWVIRDHARYLDVNIFTRRHLQLLARFIMCVLTPRISTQTVSLMTSLMKKISGVIMRGIRGVHLSLALDDTAETSCDKSAV